MVLIRIDNNNKVTSYHQNPSSLSNEEQANGIMVDSIPTREQIKGKKGVFMYDETTNTVYIDYIDRPLRQEEIIENLQNDMDYLILKQEGLI